MSVYESDILWLVPIIICHETATCLLWTIRIMILRWRHNEHDGVPNHQRLNYLLNRLFKRRSKKTSKLRVTGPLCRELTGDRLIPRTKGQ